jgi:hypothetical protein
VLDVGPFGEGTLHLFGLGTITGFSAQVYESNEDNDTLGAAKGAAITSLPAMVSLTPSVKYVYVDVTTVTGGGSVGITYQGTSYD